VNNGGTGILRPQLISVTALLLVSFFRALDIFPLIFRPVVVRRTLCLLLTIHYLVTGAAGRVAGLR